MVKTYGIIGLIAVSVLLSFGTAAAIDTPHTGNCQACHMLHNSLGSSLTNQDTNANLCMSCHTTAGTAFQKPFASSDQANIGPGRTSHSWSGLMPATDNPDNAYGLRSITNLSAALKTALTKNCNKSGTTCVSYPTTCSVCHNQHIQSAAPWDPNAPAYVTGNGSGRHFMRADNNLNQLCEDCHYYRTPASMPGGTVSQTDVRTWDGNKKSHPMQLSLSGASNPSRFHTAPVEPEAAAWAAQTGSRFQGNGGTDTNPTNNLVFDSSQQIRCLTCHGIHYTDSDSGTVDQP